MPKKWGRGRHYNGSGYKTLIDKLFVVLNITHYDIAWAIDEMGQLKRGGGLLRRAKAHRAF